MPRCHDTPPLPLITMPLFATPFAELTPFRHADITSPAPLPRLTTPARVLTLRFTPCHSFAFAFAIFAVMPLPPLFCADAFAMSDAMPLSLLCRRCFSPFHAVRFDAAATSLIIFHFHAADTPCC
jgi:hypothetical protein